VRAGRIRHLAFAVPDAVSWSLPLYELALLTAARLDSEEAKGVTLITPEAGPLELFGAEASARVRALLESRGIDVLTRACPVKAVGGRVSLADGSCVPADHTITVPSLQGPGLLGLPSDAEGFIPVDAHGRVKGADDVYAAGTGRTSRSNRAAPRSRRTPPRRRSRLAWARPDSRGRSSPSSVRCC
jgi:sulfide:quinone oxidoreductase